MQIRACFCCEHENKKTVLVTEVKTFFTHISPGINFEWPFRFIKKIKGYFAKLTISTKPRQTTGSGQFRRQKDAVGVGGIH